MSMRDAGGLLKRRGLLAGVAALVGAGLARLSAPVPAYAANLVLGGSNDSGAARTLLFGTSAFGMFTLVGTQGPALLSISGTPAQQAARVNDQTTTGVFGSSDTGHGVVGNCDGVSAGVRAFGNTSGIGLWADANSRVGVFGTSTGSTGVFGVSSASNPNGTAAPTNYAGVSGQGVGRIGVQGISDSGYGVQGTSNTGIGVYGVSTQSHGCGGTTTSAGQAGLFGSTSAVNATAMLGVHTQPGGLAGFFSGNVYVTGTMTVASGAKSAAVAHPDGSHRRMYCQEAPEPWFEDFGTAQLQGGKATVRLDPDFAAVVKADQYSVFPIPEGECKGLYVAAKTPTGFEVRELQGGTSSAPFSYRLVSRRKDDVGRRMEKVDVPAFDVEKLRRQIEAPAPGAERGR